MRRQKSSKSDNAATTVQSNAGKRRIAKMNAMGGHRQERPVSPQAQTETLEILSFLEEFSDELEGALDIIAPNAHLRMALHLLQGHFEAKTITPTSLISASRVPYATANRRLKEMVDAGVVANVVAKVRESDEHRFSSPGHMRRESKPR